MFNTVKAEIEINGQKVKIIADYMAAVIYKRNFRKDLLKTMLHYRNLSNLEITPQLVRDLAEIIYAYVKRANPKIEKFHNWRASIGDDAMVKLFVEISKQFNKVVG